MKKQILTSMAVAMITMLSFAQPNLDENGFTDDFSTVTEYSDTGNVGIFWWGETIHNMTRDSDNSRLEIEMYQNQGMYTPFGVGFGDSNGELVGGDPYTIDISQNGQFSFDVENYGTQDLAIRVACIDENDNIIDYYNGTTVFGDVWRYQIQIIVPAGESMTFEAGTDNGAGGNHINTADFVGGIWARYDINPHVLSTDCDLTKIRGINITVLNGEKDPNDGHHIALTDGKFRISNFRLGSFAVGLADDSKKITFQFIQTL